MDRIEMVMYQLMKIVYFGSVIIVMLSTLFVFGMVVFGVATL